MDGLVVAGFLVVAVAIVLRARFGGGSSAGSRAVDRDESIIGLDPYMPGNSVWKRHDD